MTMITVRIEPHPFAALRTAFEAAAGDGDAPINREVMARLQAALADAEATALPGLPIVLMLPSARELRALSACFEVYGECDPNVTAA